jgi:ATPase subunit of ABC transporter with duplicated ATPase domains
MKPIFLNNASLFFSSKTCFENFSAQIQSGDRIAIIGNNSSGKSSLLKIIKGDLPLSEGEIINNKDINFGYVKQIIDEYENLSGGEKFNKALSFAFSAKPDILLLDEPTNHLDLKNRRSLIKMLKFYRNTLIIVSHDEELLSECVDNFWHINNGKINIFKGNYYNYKASTFQKREILENELLELKKEKKSVHQSLMKEQERAAKSKKRGEKFVEQKKWLPAVGDLKASSAGKTAGKKNKHNRDKRNDINQELASLRIPEIIKPKFSLAADLSSKTILQISSGSVFYENKKIADNINFSVAGNEKLAIIGDNGSGKTTILKAIMQDNKVFKTGDWTVPNVISYLDQYYKSLNDNKTVLETICDLMPNKTHLEVRDFLNDFLFKKNEDVTKLCGVLSGGEKARLALAQIAAQTPQLLLIDEITNNVDVETKEHIIQVLKEYPGAMIIVSHDENFLKDIEVSNFYKL